MNNIKTVTNGKMIRFLEADKVSDSLEVGVYVLNQNPQTEEFYLVSRDELKLPPKIYGNNDIFTNRVLKSYKALGGNCNVLLSGVKGSGKSVQAAHLCIASNQPVILINSAFSGDKFVEFLENIKTPCSLFFDEFEKLYKDEEDKNIFLPILDGAVKSIHLFIFTSNSSQIGEYFTSRPGRVRYHKEYHSLDDTIIAEVVNDKLENKENLNKVLDVLSKYHGLSMDSVCAIVSECNIFNETPDQFADIFNVSSQRPKFWDVSVNSTDWVIKPNLTKAELERVDDEDICEPGDKDFELFYEEVKAKYHSSYCRFLTGSQSRPGVETYLSTENSKESKLFYWDYKDIAKFEESRSFIQITHRNGEVLTATPCSDIIPRTI